MCLLASACVLRSVTGGSTSVKQQRIACGRRDWRRQPECPACDPALGTTSPSWRTTAPAPGRPRHAPQSPPGNHVRPPHTEQRQSHTEGRVHQNCPSKMSLTPLLFTLIYYLYYVILLQYYYVLTAKTYTVHLFRVLLKSLFSSYCLQEQKSELFPSIFNV